RLKEIADLLQIAPLLNRKPRQLSGGQRQRVAMGRALVRQPSVFLFDEPLSNLDAKLRVDMRVEIKKLYQKLGATIIYVTHDQVEALTLSTRIAVMNHGVIEQIGAPQDIYDAPANLFVAAFIGSPAMNLIDATVVDAGGKLCAETTDADGATLRLALASGDKLRGHLGRQIILGVRPEALTDAGSAGARIESVQNRVIVVEPTGADTFVTTSFGGRDCVARMPADRAPRPGDTAEFAVNMDKAVAFDADTHARIA
ncbi:MAG: ATP-binding cassette domain-containing protein, partial [Gammaproteobacteria bacterium]|nr:ATP-binding cassette domain-containing protein [Gammaproteobacteria bacterium]